MSVLITSDQTMFIETSANFYLPGEGSNNRQVVMKGSGFCKGKHILLTDDLDIYTKPPIHFLLPGEGGEHMAFLMIEGIGGGGGVL